MTNITFTTIGAAVLGWEALYRCFGFASRMAAQTPGLVHEGGSRAKLAEQGASYGCAFVHACLVSYRGVVHLWELYDAPIMTKLQLPDGDSQFYAAAAATEVTNVFFLSYLIYDVVHVVSHFPTLGGADTIAHHFGFIVAAIICGSARVLPFQFAWLLCGELSSPFLDIRWLLITCGRGASRALQWTNLCFGMTFFLVRVVAYGMGIVHLYMHRDALAQIENISQPALRFIMVLLAFAYTLNLVWMRKILRMATAKERGKRN